MAYQIKCECAWYSLVHSEYRQCDLVFHLMLKMEPLQKIKVQGVKICILVHHLTQTREVVKKTITKFGGCDRGISVFLAQGNNGKVEFRSDEELITAAGDT